MMVGNRPSQVPLHMGVRMVEALKHLRIEMMLKGNCSPSHELDVWIKTYSLNLD